LREKQGFGRTGETTELGDSNEDLEPAKVHQTRKARAGPSRCTPIKAGEA
jgi:hypothetical protein